MPSRLLREGILDSEAVNSLSFAAEVFYRRLMSVVDDFGRFDGRPTVLRSRLYPLRVETVRESEIEAWVGECERVGLVARYVVDGKPYLLFHKLGNPRAKQSKFPEPPTATERPANPAQSPTLHLRADVNGCVQTRADVPYSDSYSGSDSITGSMTDSGSTRGGGSVDPPAESFDPLRAAEAARKLFERRWAAAGLAKYSRLSPTVQNQLAALLLDSWWAENYPAALAKAGAIPFLAAGVGRQGPMDVAFFLRDGDVVRKILDGVYDPRSAAAGPATDRRAAELDAVFNEDAAKRKAG